MLLKPPTGSLQASVAQRQHRQQQQKYINDDRRRRYENIKVANENLKKFAPHVRSESWFKVSMIVYPIFIFYYFAVLLLIIGSISWQIIAQVYDQNEACISSFGVHLLADSNCRLANSQTFYELLYTVPAFSISSSFYCSYYFSTMLELFVWELELNQQLNVCIQNICLETMEQVQQMRCESGPIYEHLDWEFNEFGGLSRIWFHLWWQLKASSSTCNRRRELWAWRLLDKRETLFRATYINFNLFLDEYRATRHLSEKILTRTTQIAIAFAFLVSISHLQFQSSIMRMAMLLGAAQLILNLYLWSAALINTMANRILNKMQKLNALCRKHHRPDLANIFARYTGQHGFEMDEFAYALFNEKITWRNIFNFNGKVTSAYMFTLK